MPKDALLKLVFGADTKEVDAALSKVQKSVGNLGASMTKAGGIMTAAFTAPVAGLVKLGMEFDDAMDKIRVGTGATGKNLTELGETFKKVYSSVPASVDSASTAIAELNTRLELTGEPLADLSMQVLNLSRITGTDLKTNIDAITKAFGDAGVAQEDYASALDWVFKVSQSTGVEMARLLDLMKTYGSPLRQLGYDWETAAAMIAKFEKEGVNTELVLGSLRIALTNFAREGIADPVSALQDLIEQIENAGSAGEANAIAIEAFGARAGPDMAAAIREGRLSIDELVNSLRNSSESIQKAAEDTAGLSEKMDLLKQRATVALEPLGTAIMDTVERHFPALESALASATEWFTSLGTAGQDSIAKITLGLAVGGPLLTGLGLLVSSISKFNPSFTTLAGLLSGPVGIGLAAATALIWGLNRAMEINSQTTKTWNEQLRELSPPEMTTTPGGYAMPTSYITPGRTPVVSEISTTSTAWASALKQHELSQSFDQLAWEAEQTQAPVIDLASGFSGLTDSLEGTAEQAEKTITPMEKLCQLIASEAVVFKPWTQTERTLYEMKQISDQYDFIAGQAKIQYEWEEKAREAREKQLEALKEMTDLMSATRPESGFYTSISEILDSIISKYETLLQSVAEGKPYVEPQWNVGQQALLDWLQSSGFGILSELSNVPGRGREDLIQKFTAGMESTLAQANEKLFAEMNIPLSFEQFQTLPRKSRML